MQFDVLENSNYCRESLIPLLIIYIFFVVCLAVYYSSEQRRKFKTLCPSEICSTTILSLVYWHRTFSSATLLRVLHG